MKRCRLIVNPISGTRSKQGLGEALAVRLGPDWTVETCPTEYAGHATTLAAEAAADGHDAVIAAGGDGTVNETARALCGTATALGIIPCGSGNGLARHLNIPVDNVASLDIIAGGRTLDVDTGSVNGRPFFCTFGVGFDAAVSERFARKNRRGLFSYFQSALETFRNYRPQTYTITANGSEVTHKALLVAVCNASQYGNNAYIAPGASMLDGLFDVLILHSDNPLSAVRLGLDMMAGTLGSNAGVDMIRTSSLTITRLSDDISHIDGEPVESLGERLALECRPATLRVFVPENIPAFTPLITPLQAFGRDILLTFSHLFRQ